MPSWDSSLIARLGRTRGPLITALVYLLGPGFYTRRFYRHQGRLAPWSDTRHGYLTLSLDVDHRQDVEALPLVCGLLKKLGLEASFAVVGKWVEEFPGQHRLLVDSGFELINHTYSHPDNQELNPGQRFDKLSRQERKTEIERCHQVCADLLGTKPEGFRAPHFGNVASRDFYLSLAELGYRFSSSVISVDSPGFGLPFQDKSGVWEFPVSCCPRHPFSVLDTWHSLKKPKPCHPGTGELAGLVTSLAGLVSRHGGYLNLYLDPRDIAGFAQAREALHSLAGMEEAPKIISYGNLLARLGKYHSRPAS